MIVAGIGARQGVEGSEILALIERALAQARLDPTSLGAIATAEAKAGEPGFAAAAKALNVPLRLVSIAAMQAATAGVTRSPGSERLFGVSSVSEAAALTVAGQNSELILPRITSAKVTCALARGLQP